MTRFQSLIRTKDSDCRFLEFRFLAPVRVFLLLQLVVVMCACHPSRERLREWAIRGNGDVDVLAQAASDTTFRYRSAAIECLGRSGSPEAAAHLLPLLFDSSKNTRSEAAHALGMLAVSGVLNTSVTSRLVVLLNDEQYEPRSAIAVALGATGNSLSVRALARLLVTKDTELKRSLLTALADALYFERENLLLDTEDGLYVLECLKKAWNLEDNKEIKSGISNLILGIQNRRGQTWGNSQSNGPVEYPARNGQP